MQFVRNEVSISVTESRYDSNEMINRKPHIMFPLFPSRERMARRGKQRKVG